MKWGYNEKYDIAILSKLGNMASMLSHLEARLNAIELKIESNDNEHFNRQFCDRIEKKLSNMADVLEVTRKYTYRSEIELMEFRSMWVSDVLDRDGIMATSSLYQHIRSIHDALSLMDLDPALEQKLRRIGKRNDGGYIMLDDFTNHKIAYSFGINDNVSWDKEMAKRGLDVYMYDHTIESLPEENEKFHWKKVGITGTYDEKQPNLKTLDMLIKENGHENECGMILKIDIEGSEWDVLKKIDDSVIKQFSQIVIELHGLIETPYEERIAPCLMKLSKYMQLVHVHGNSCSGYAMAHGLVLPDVLECTFANKDEYSFALHKGFLPGKLDQSNKPDWPDIPLGNWQ